MAGFFKTLFKHRSIIDELKTSLRDAKRDNTTLTTDLSEAQKQISELTSKKESGPWIQITGADYDPTRGFRIDVDWNKDFLKVMREEGMNGPTEEATVQRWLAMMNLNIIDGLEAEAMAADPRGTVPDVVTDKHLIDGDYDGTA